MHDVRDFFFFLSLDTKKKKGPTGSPCGVVSYVLDYDVILNEFELQSRYFVHFRKGMNFLIPSYGFK